MTHPSLNVWHNREELFEQWLVLYILFVVLLTAAFSLFLSPPPTLSLSLPKLMCSDVADSSFPPSKREKEYLMERQELAIEFLFCLVLIEVLTKLSVHPVPESFIHTIEDYAFKHFKMQEALKDRC